MAEEEDVGFFMGEEEGGKLLRKQDYISPYDVMGEFVHLLITTKMSLQKFCAIQVKKEKSNSGELSSVPAERKGDKMSKAFEGPLRRSSVNAASLLCIQPTMQYSANSDRAVVIQGQFSVIFFLSFLFFLFLFSLHSTAGNIPRMPKINNSSFPTICQTLLLIYRSFCPPWEQGDPEVPPAPSAACLTFARQALCNHVKKHFSGKSNISTFFQ